MMYVAHQPFLLPNLSKAWSKPKVPYRQGLNPSTAPSTIVKTGSESFWISTSVAVDGIYFLLSFGLAFRSSPASIDIQRFYNLLAGRIFITKAMIFFSDDRLLLLPKALFFRGSFSKAGPGFHHLPCFQRQPIYLRVVIFILSQNLFLVAMRTAITPRNKPAIFRARLY